MSLAGPEHDRGAPAYCLSVQGDAAAPVRRFYLYGGQCYDVGSSSEADVHLPVAGISRRHARIDVLADGGVVIEDLGSRNGTWVGQQRVSKAAVTGGELISFGSLVTELVVQDQALARIAIAPARSTVAAAQVPPVPERERPSTVGLSLEERLIRSLAPTLGHHGARSVAVAQELTAAWLAELPVERVEIVRDGDGTGQDEVIAAAGGVASDRTADAEVTGFGWRLRFWGAIAERLYPLRPLLLLALEMLAAENPVPAAGVVEAAATPAPGSLAPAMNRLYRRVAKVARGQIPILIRGESGCGKEVLARFVHDASPRREGPFVPLNCAALPKELLEAELFGIERGVATGVDARQGLLEQASGGTLFLDEIGDMAAATQAKVLRALEEGKVYRVGGRSPIDVNVRFVAATHRDLEALIESGGFRRDLYHRLAAHVARIPPLRERREDVALLAGHFFRRELEQSAVSSPGLTRGALGALCEYPWPGNVRELINEIAQAVLLLDPGEPLGLDHLSERVRGALAPDAVSPLTLEAHLHRAERQAFAAAVATSGGDAARAMDQLGVSKATYYRKLKELGLDNAG